MAFPFARTAIVTTGAALVITTAATLFAGNSPRAGRNRPSASGTSAGAAVRPTSTPSRSSASPHSARSAHGPSHAHAATSPAAVPPPSPAAVQQHVFAIDDGAFPNPDRGFFEGFDSPVTTGQLDQVRRDGFTLAHLDVDLGAFRGTPLSEALLGAVADDFAAARAAGIKLIPRFAYDFTAAGNDAPLPVVLGHIHQLAPLLQRNEDVIVYLDAGFIGAWGEWHNSANNLITHVIGGFEQVNQATRSIIDALLAALPADRSVLVRTQRYKYALVGTSNLTPGSAYSGSTAARLGFFNDCLFADGSDAGTYLVRATDEAWLARETEFVPISGETCSDGASAQPLVQCPNALAELSRLHWNSLNTIWFAGVIQTWKTQGCWQQISDRLGYRFSLVTAAAPVSVDSGGRFQLQLAIRNSGFAAMHTMRPVEVILRETSTGQQHTIRLAVDPRTWLPGRTTTVISTLTLPAGLAAGRYELLLAMPDPASSLSGRPEYAVRFADQGSWDPQTGTNALGLAVSVR